MRCDIYVRPVDIHEYKHMPYDMMDIHSSLIDMGCYVDSFGEYDVRYTLLANGVTIDDILSTSVVRRPKHRILMNVTILNEADNEVIEAREVIL